MRRYYREHSRDWYPRLIDARLSPTLTTEWEMLVAAGVPPNLATAAEIERRRKAMGRAA